MHVRVCPECEEEYRPEIAACADCGADLVDRWEDEHGRVVNVDGTLAADSSVEPLEPGVPARALFTGPPAPLRILADALVAAGVPFQLVPDERLLQRSEGARLILVTPETDAERALAALEEFRGRGTEMGFTEMVQTWVHADGEAPPCPACGAPVPADAPSCPDCGLELGGSEE
jgi:hypothetical protein